MLLYQNNKRHRTARRQPAVGFRTTVSLRSTVLLWGTGEFYRSALAFPLEDLPGAKPVPVTDNQ